MFSKKLAGALAVGRTTVVGAYELLRSEGRITRRQGSGTRVAGTPTSGAIEDAPVDPMFLDSLESRDDDVLLAVCAAPGEALADRHRGHATRPYRTSLSRSLDIVPGFVS